MWEKVVEWGEIFDRLKPLLTVYSVDFMIFIGKKDLAGIDCRLSLHPVRKKRFSSLKM